MAIPVSAAPAMELRWRFLDPIRAMTHANQETVSLGMGVADATPTLTVRAVTPSAPYVLVVKLRLPDPQAWTTADPLWIPRLFRAIPVQVIKICLIFASIASLMSSVQGVWMPSAHNVIPAVSPMRECIDVDHDTRFIPVETLHYLIASEPLASYAPRTPITQFALGWAFRSAINVPPAESLCPGPLSDHMTKHRAQTLVTPGDSLLVKDVVLASLVLTAWEVPPPNAPLVPLD